MWCSFIESILVDYHCACSNDRYNWFIKNKIKIILTRSFHLNIIFEHTQYHNI
jgi:hypothetical protein